MLILTRRPTECVRIGNNVILEIVSVQGTRVRLGISAPKDIAVDRAEIRELKTARPKIGGQSP